MREEAPGPHPDKFFRYSEADLQSGDSIMLVESRELEHFNGVVAGISFKIIRF
jgi:hypothetical protein